MVCAIGAFTVSNAEFDIVLMLVFGVVGYVMKKLDYPLAPLVLALVLGDRTEEAFRQSLLVSQGDLGVFFKSWLERLDHGRRHRPAAWPVLGWLRGVVLAGIGAGARGASVRDNKVGEERYSLPAPLPFCSLAPAAPRVPTPKNR